MQYQLINLGYIWFGAQAKKKLVMLTVFDRHVVWGLSSLWCLSAKCWSTLTRRSKLIMLISYAAIVWETLSRAQTRPLCFRGTK